MTMIIEIGNFATSPFPSVLAHTREVEVARFVDMLEIHFDAPPEEATQICVTYWIPVQLHIACTVPPSLLAI